MDKYIFLSFDGVIATEKSQHKLDYDAVKKLGRILDMTGAKIVVTSTWRKSDLKNTLAYLEKPSSYVPFPFPYIDKVIDIATIIRCNSGVDSVSVPVGLEIGHWIRMHINFDADGNYSDKVPGIDYQYVILDDDSSVMYSQRNHLVKTDARTGLSNENVRKAIKILNSTGYEGEYD